MSRCSNNNINTVFIWMLCVTILNCYTDGLSIPRTLILYDDPSFLSTYSEFLMIVKSMNHELTLKSTSQSSVKLSEHNKNLYENILLLIKDSKDSNFKQSVSEITQYLDIGGNMMLIADTNSPPKIRKIINQLGYNMYSAGSLIHSNNRISIDDNAIAINPIDSVINVKAIVDKNILQGPLLYRGNVLRHMLNNKWTINVVNAPHYDFFKSASTDSLNPTINKGMNMVLIGAVQMRNNHRVSIIPSVEFFGNKFINEPFTDNNNYKNLTMSSNRQFISELLLWNFLEKSVLRVSNPQHKLVATGKPKQQYSVMELIEYSVDIEEKTPNGWIPFVNNDVQFSLERMITHMRVFYNRTNDGKFFTSYHIPDYIGLYKCITEYDRIGYTNLNHYVQIVVRPLRHDEFPRYIIKCWPFYFTSFLMLAMTMILSFVIINMKDNKKKTE